MTILLAGTSTTSSTTTTTPTPSELTHFTATSPAIGDNRHYVLRYAVQLSFRSVSVSTVGRCLLSLLTRDTISLYLVQGLAHIYIMRVAQLLLLKRFARWEVKRTFTLEAGIHFDDTASLPTCSVIHFITISVTPNFKCIVWEWPLCNSFYY